MTEEEKRLRDEFAMAALTGLMTGHTAKLSREVLDAAAEIAFYLADAMMKAREVKS